MKFALWRYRPDIKVRPARPQQRRDTGGAAARQKTEASLHDDRETREESAPMLAWLRRDYERNHYADAIATVFRGGPQ